MTKSKKLSQSIRALAKVLHRSPSHICRVMNGKRSSRRLASELMKHGVKIQKKEG